jgi:hypothetical protein
VGWWRRRVHDLDPADLPTALDVTVAEATGYTVDVYGKPAVQVSG